MNLTKTFRRGITNLESSSSSPTAGISSSSSSTVGTSFSTTHLSTIHYVTSSTSPKVEYQYYVIGVYAFFAVIFTIGLVMILVTKLKKACCSSKKDDLIDYESVPVERNFNPHDNLAFEHDVVNVDNLEVERIQDNNSDYDYYSDAGSETDRLADVPPAYEHPPSYSIVVNG